MGKAAALAVIAFGILGTYYSTSTYQGVLQSNEEVAGHQYEVLARMAAMTGYNLASQRLTEGFGSDYFVGTHHPGKYTVTTTVSGTHAKIKSVGTVVSAEGDTASYTALAEFEQTSSAIIPEEAPVFMRYALFSEEDLELKGNVLGDILVTGTARSMLNANMHTNGYLRISGNSITVKGFGTYTKGATANPAKALLGSFEPNYNPANEPSAQQTAAVEAPDFDITAFLNNVVVDKTDADVVLTGTYDLGGTREDPYIWHITGNMTVLGNATISGYAMFLVENHIILSGNVLAGASGYDGPDESNLALYAGGGINLGGNVEVYGQLFSQGDVVFAHGTPFVYGSITTRGMADVVGTPKIYYRTPSPALTTNWQDNDIEINLVAYSEW
jgi:hypothetical protein